MFRKINTTVYGVIQNDNYFLNDYDYVKLTEGKTVMLSKLELKVNFKSFSFN